MAYSESELSENRGEGDGETRRVVRTPSPGHPFTGSSIHVPLFFHSTLDVGHSMLDVHLFKGFVRGSEFSENRGEGDGETRRAVRTPSPGHPFTGSINDALHATLYVHVFRELHESVQGSGSVRIGEGEMGRRGESFAPRLRVTPSPVQVFMCSMRRSIRKYPIFNSQYSIRPGLTPASGYAV